MKRNNTTKENGMRKIMERLSEVMKDIPLPIPVSRGIQIETKTDAYQVVWNEYSLQMYLESFGDVEVEWDSEWKVYRVPAFRAEIERFTAAKDAHCKIWGCE
jgi:hypothetical protein